jgi:hypothetical protein
MNHIYRVNKYTYARYCTETDIFLKTTTAGSGSGFGGEISGSGSRSGKKVRIRPVPDPDPQHWPIVLAQYKEKERIGEARLTIRSASPIVIEIAYYFCCTDRKRKYVYYETTAELKLQNNAQRHSPRPIRNDWRYFRPTLVFAGHYL